MCKNIKESLDKEDFNLENKYCDENDLRLSWSNMQMPNFAGITLKIKSLFQIIFYTMNDGRKRTPFHILTGLSIYHHKK